MKKRSILVMILLSLVTCGIYYLYWYCSFQNQIKKETGIGFTGVGHFFVTIFTLGIYQLYWYFVLGGRLAKMGAQNNGVLYGILSLIGLGLVSSWLAQNDANAIAK